VTRCQELAQLADGRPLLFAGLFLPVLGWVAFNIAAPAFRQLAGMADKATAAPTKGKKRSVAAAMTGLTAAALMAAPEHADAAQELVQLADGRPLLFAGLFLPVLGWVAFNIAAPAFRQLAGMADKATAAPTKGKKR
jgi:photosystem II PsbY protein